MKKGSSLVEAICALLILAFGIIGSIASIKLSIQNFTAAKTTEIATRINQTIATDLELVDFDLIPNRVNSLPQDYIYTFEGKNIGSLGEPPTGNDAPYFEISSVIANQLTADLYQIDITVTWLSHTADRDLGLGYEEDNLAYQHNMLIARKEVD